MGLGRYVGIVIRDFSAFGGIPFVILMLLFLIGLKEYSLFFQIALGVFLVEVTSIVIRLIKFRDRPLKISYSNIVEKIDASSFPSMHSGTVTVYAILFGLYANSWLVNLLLGAVALGVYFSRIYMRKHYFSDVIAGIFIGMLVAMFIVNINLPFF